MLADRMRDVKITVIGRVPEGVDKLTVLRLNRCLEEYFNVVKFFLSFNNTSLKELHKLSYEEAKMRFSSLPTALIETAMKRSIEILKSFKKNGREDSKLKLKRISIRFDERCYDFSKSSQAEYQLSLKVDKEKRIIIPVMFGDRQKEIIEEVLKSEWKLGSMEMVKKEGKWYAHFKLKKTITFSGMPETVIGIDIGERLLAVVVAISRTTGKILRVKIWRGSEIKKIRWQYYHDRKSLQEKKLLHKLKELKDRERRKVKEQLHIISKEIVEFAKQFPKPMIVMEELEGLRESIDYSRELNRRLHNLPYRKLQKLIEYKSLLNGIEVVYVDPNNSSRTCCKCGHINEPSNSREFKCSRCGAEYNRDVNAAANIARKALTMIAKYLY
ncbi:MAG: transposase [Nitrososphaerota archaeon]